MRTHQKPIWSLFFFFAQRKNQPVMMQHKDQEFTQTRINRPRHSKHKDTHGGLKFKKAIQKQLQRHNGVIG